MPALICGLVRPHGFVPATHAVLEAKARHHSQERGWTSRLHWAASFGASIEAGPGRPGTEPRSSKSIRIASRKSRNRIHCFASNSKCTACSVPSLRSRILEDQEMIQLVHAAQASARMLQRMRTRAVASAQLFPNFSRSQKEAVLNVESSALVKTSV